MFIGPCDGILGLAPVTRSDGHHGGNTKGKGWKKPGEDKRVRW